VIRREASIDRAAARIAAVAADDTRSPAERIQALLEIGRDHFGLPIGLVSHIEDGCYEVRYAATPKGEVMPGQTFDLERTYCCHTLEANGPLGFHEAGKSPIAVHPCYRDFKLESYIGIPLIVGGRLDGTLNYSGWNPRHAPFEPEDLAFMEQLAARIAEQLGAPGA